MHETFRVFRTTDKSIPIDRRRTFKSDLSKNVSHAKQTIDAIQKKRETKLAGSKNRLLMLFWPNECVYVTSFVIQFYSTIVERRLV